MELSERAMLVNLNISSWSAEREDKKAADAVSAKYGSDPSMGKYRKSLVDPTALKPLQKLQSEARTRHYELTLPWGDNGDRIITTEGFWRYREEMNDFAVRIDEEATRFAEEYPRLVEKARYDLNGLFRDTDYPSPDTIRSKFGFKTRFKNLNDAEDFRVKLGTLEQEAIREQMRLDMESQLGEAMGDVAKRIRKAVEHMAARLRAYNRTPDGKVENKFHDTLVSNVKELAELVPALNITNDPKVAEIAGEMRSELARWDADSLRESVVLRGKVADKAEAIIHKMNGYGL